MRTREPSAVESTRPFLFFDYFRVPYALDPLLAGDLLDRSPLRLCGHVRQPDGGATLTWAAGGALDPAGAPAVYDLGGDPLITRVLRDETVGEWLKDDPRTWKPTDPIRTPDGTRVSSIWKAADRSVFLPFDPGDVMSCYWREAYHDVIDSRRVLKRVARRSYYRIRPLLPRPVQLVLRRRYSRIQRRTAFPRWPSEPGLHNLYELLFRLLTDTVGSPIPSIAPWPDGHSWALVLSHDVETAAGLAGIWPVARLEASLGFRSSWNLVPKRYAVDDELVRRLWDDGFEVGLHGLYHDGRDLESKTLLLERLPQMRDWAERWRASGFRAPATQRGWDLMPLLGLAYDSSYPDADPFEPQGGGCCTWLPFMNHDLVELPITLPQDHTLFTILEEDAAEIWGNKTEQLRRAGGLALMLTHPDYLADDHALRTYSNFLEAFADDRSAWRALPKDVAAWWRQRQQSELAFRGGRWQVSGPIAERAQIVLTSPERERITSRMSSVSRREPSLASER